jgi:hypothetical protein
VGNDEDARCRPRETTDVGTDWFAAFGTSAVGLELLDEATAAADDDDEDAGAERSGSEPPVLILREGAWGVW